MVASDVVVAKAKAKDAGLRWGKVEAKAGDAGLR